MVTLLKPLQPMSAQRAAWEQRVTDLVADIWGTDYSDASGFLTLHEVLLDELYEGGANARTAAHVLTSIDENT